MSKVLLFFLFHCFCSFACRAQPPAVLQWQKSYGGSKHDFPNDFEILPDGSIVILGVTYSNNGDFTGNYSPTDSSDVYLLKLDAQGNKLWHRMYGGTKSDNARALIKTGDGGLLFAGNSNSADGDLTGVPGNKGYWMVKTDLSGNILWQKSYGGSGNEIAVDVIEVSDGYVVAGSTRSTDGDVSFNNGLIDIWLIKTDF